MSKKPVTKEQQNQIAVLAANNRSVTAIARETGLHAQTVKKQLQEPVTLEMIEVASKYLGQKMLNMADQIVSAMTPEDISKANLRDKAVAAGILMDKARLCYGMDKPTAQANVFEVSPVCLDAY
jgi:DNA-binding IclR family transcriptional regulator